MRLAVDTNAYSDFVLGVPLRVRGGNAAAELFLPFIVLAELRAGFALGRHGPQNERGLQSFLSSTRVKLLWADEGTVMHYVALFAYLRRHGTPIPENDLWIAALVLQHGLTLCTSDAHFQHLPQVPRC